MLENEDRYLSYLLRLWQTSDGEKKVWRASLESPGTDERRGFACLTDLFNFLEAQTSQSPTLDESSLGPARQIGEGG